LVAKHYAVADERIARLIRAYDVSLDEVALRRTFEGARAKAAHALSQLENDYMTQRARKLPQIFENAVEDFDAAIRGISSQRAANQARLRVLVGYRDDLRRQGTRSLRIRVDRSLQDPYVGDALVSTQEALDSAGRWVSFQGEAHLGAFLRRTWVKVLLALIGLGASLLLVRVARRLVDRWIERKVEAYPEFADRSASVREERERARESREALDEAHAHLGVEEILQQGADSGQVQSPEEKPAQATEEKAQ
jgi:Arc/MetJ-type ribon-helix-helix transcriptional regulator